MKLTARMTAVLLVLNLCVFPSSADTNITTGSKCAPQGSTRISNSKMFTCIASGKKLIWDSGQNPLTKNPIYVANPNYPQSPVIIPASLKTVNKAVQSPTLSSFADCQLLDQRNDRQQPNNVGFPITPDVVPHLGQTNVIFIPIDFSDAAGSPAFLNMMNKQLDTMSEWYDFFSNKKFHMNIIKINKWFRASKPSSSYFTGQTHANTPNDFAKEMNAIAQEFIDTAGNAFDYSSVTGVFFFFPETASKLAIRQSILGRNVVLNTPIGPKNLFYFGPGLVWGYNLEATINQPYSRFWAWWIHEILHSQGLALHAPGNGFNLGVQSFEQGSSQAIDAWETFLLGWYDENQVYCAPIEKLKSSTVLLQPIELQGIGFKTAIVPLNSHEALVVESRRAQNWSKDWNSSDNGTLVYLVDTQKDNNRSNEEYGDTGNELKYSKWAYLLKPQGRVSVVRKNESICGIDNCYYSPKPDDYYNYLMKVGDSVTYKNIKISLVESASKDAILIEKS